MKHFNNPERYQSMQPFYFLSSRSMTSATIRSDHPAKTTTARSRENNGGKIQLFQNSSHMRRQNAPLLGPGSLVFMCSAEEMNENRIIISRYQIFAFSYIKSILYPLT